MMMNISLFFGEEMLQTCSVWCFSIYNNAYSTQLSPALIPIELLLAMDPHLWILHVQVFISFIDPDRAG
jgi:hypothetical protein